MSKNKKKDAALEPEIIKGSGSYTFEDGSLYDGEWQEVNGNKVRHGTGTFTLGIEKYVGQWENDIMNGEGEYQFASGAVYKGTFKNNMFEGQGHYTFPDGGHYNGQWSQNKMHGQGCYVDTEQREFRGQFINGIFKNDDSYFPVRNS